jgi:DNA-binding GntR family transcriptional regulator
LFLQNATTTIRRRGVSKSALVYEDLRAAIVDLRLEPGSRIDKEEICERLAVSRQPVAEAIARLTEERLVEVHPQKGTYVAWISLERVSEAAFLRRGLEVAVVEAIAVDIDEATLKSLDRCLEYQAIAVKAKEFSEFFQLDLRFHQMLFDGLNMPRVAEVVESSRAHLDRARRLLLPTPRGTQQTLREHRAIYDALALRQPSAAVAAMGAHLDKGMTELREFAAINRELFGPLPVGSPVAAHAEAA